MATITVTTLNDVVADDGLVSLREAITAANTDTAGNNAPAGSGADIIRFQDGLNGTIRLLTTGLTLSQDVTIIGDTNADLKADITISGDKNNSGDADAGDVRIFSVSNGVQAAFHSLTLTRGYAEFGGAIDAENATVDIVNSTISESAASTGGGVRVGGTLTIVSSTISDNSARYGGGVFVRSGTTATIVNSTISGNQASYSGAGIATYVGVTLTIASSTIVNNTAAGSGGGLDLFHGSTANITNSVFYGNLSGSGHSDIGETSSNSTINASSSFFSTAGGLTIDSGASNLFADVAGAPGLSALADNGGPVQTRALLDTSPLRGAGNAGSLPADTFDLDGDGDVGEDLPLDAIGNLRVQGNLDIGAAEASADLIVTSGSDSGADSQTGTLGDDAADGSGLSLREAIFHAAAGAKIGFSSAFADLGTVIHLGSSLVLTQDVTIDGDVDGDGRTDISVSGDGAVRIFDITAGDVVLESLYLSSGRAASSYGGAIRSASGSTLLLNGVTVAYSTSTLFGGGIHTEGTLIAINSAFYSNSGFKGGAISLNGTGRAALLNTTVSGNFSGSIAGAVYGANGTQIKLYSSTITGNYAYSMGGGIYLYGASLESVNSVIAGNRADTASDVFNSSGTFESSFSFLGAYVIPTTDGGNNLRGDDPMLGALADNGGAVRTMRPLEGSLLIGAGSNLQVNVGQDVFDIDHDGNTTELTPIDARGGARIEGTIDIGAVETHAPVITSNGGGATAAVNVAEDTTAVTTVTSSDPDFNATRTFSISGGADAGKFNINSSTGALTFKSAPNREAPTDAGANNVYDVTVRVSDGSASDTQAIAVTVTNVNEAPVITSNGGGATAAVNVAENTTAVTTVTSSDPDTGATKTFSISGGADAGKFNINSSTGALTFKSAPNREAPTDAGANNVYDVTVRVSDGSASDTQALAVTVTNVNEAPVITTFSGAATAALSRAEGSIPFPTGFAIFSATDPDGTTPTWSLSGTDAALFTIHSTGALSFVARPDFEAPADANHDGIYEVTVTASDGSASDTQALSVTITNTVGNTIAGTKKADTIDLTHGRSGKFATGEEDTINGKAGNDTIKALGGNDTVKGGTGVDDLDGGDGIDAVDFSDMKLGVELTLKGSKQAIAKVGGVADDKLKNFESIIGGKAGDKLTGDGKANLLSGNAGNDSLNGGKGIDTLKGGLGADTLTGGKGALLDVFLFDAKLGSGNIDVVTDFKHGIDKLALDDAIFAAIGPTLETGELFSKSGAVKAKQLDDRLIYDTKTGNLSYDADGKGGTAAIHFATILDGSKPAVLDTTDILIV